VPLFCTDSRTRLHKYKFERTPRVTVVTDTLDPPSIPHEIRAVTSHPIRFVFGTACEPYSANDSDASLLWFSGERLIEGTSATILKFLHAPYRRCFVIVNTPCVDEIPFLTVQPRIIVNSASIDYWNFHIRIESSSTPAAPLITTLGGPSELWSKLAHAVCSERARPGSGVQPLLHFWESRDKIPHIFATLILRNLIALMLRHQQTADAKEFLEAGTKLYPAYAELHYLSGLLAMREHRFAEALPLLERAKSCSAVSPGSGGENSYRADWLLGVLAAQVGNDRVAFQHFLTGLNHVPFFEFSLTELLKLRLPSATIESHQYEFTRAARFNPHAVEKILKYLVLHRAFDAARRITQTIPLDTAQRENFEIQLATAIAPFRARIRNSVANSKLASDSEAISGIAFEGPFFELSSLARVNREIAHAFQSSDRFDLSLVPSTPSAHPPRLLANGNALASSVYKRLPRLDLTIRHQWPPDLRPPSTGMLAAILPWEYGGVPRVWIDQIQKNVDELWVPSNFVRDVFVRHGVSPELVTVIPNGFDPKIFMPEGATLRPLGSRDFIFLFVGGAIRRKGIDLLLDAYKSAFDPGEPVTLILLISGSSAAYQHNSCLAEIKSAANDTTQPHILPIFESIDDPTLANLYRGADAFVLPYRGEGFGMPLLEAMACSKPVITTAEGPSKDFCDSANSYLVPATAEPVPDQPPPLGPIAGAFTWFEPDFPQLVGTLRHVYENRAEAAAKGRDAARSVRQLTWQNAANLYSTRILNLCNPGRPEPSEPAPCERLSDPSPLSTPLRNP
jgi:glycosyltransferase involved in cell wall biosynthesis